MNLNDIRASYAGEKMQEGKKDPWAHYVARPLSFYISLWCVKMGVKANGVTFVSLGFGLAGCSFLVYGWHIVGAVLINICGLLDYADGNIARATGNVTEYGKRIDGASYLIITSLLFTCVGIGIGYPAMGLAVALIRILRYAITYQHNLRGESAKTNIFYKAGMFAITLRDPLLLVCVISGMLYWFLVFYAVVHLGELGIMLIRAFKK